MYFNIIYTIFFLHLTERFVFHKTFSKLQMNTLVLAFDFIHPVTSDTKIINFTLNTPYNSFIRGSIYFFETMHNTMR
jgi:hypothetical protein